MTDSAFTVTVPTASNLISSDIAELKENFEFLRRNMLNACIPIIHDARISYTYSDNLLTNISFSGALAGAGGATFTYSGGNLTVEEWSIYGKKITYNHSYSQNLLLETSIRVT